MMIGSELRPINFESVGRAKELGLQLLKMEDVFSFKPSFKKNPFKPHRISFFVLLLLTEGNMTHEVDFIKYEMKKGDCLFISKGQIHKFDQSPTYKGYGVIFTEEFMLRHLSQSAFSKISFLYNYHMNPSLFREFGDRELFINALSRELSLELGMVKSDVLASVLTVFLLKAQLHLRHYPNSHKVNYKKFTDFQNLVSSKFTETRTAKDYAEYLNVTQRLLNKITKTFTKKTAKEYISGYTILEAKRRLVTTNIPIKQVAYECGFNEATNFLKFFKKLTKLTPKEFRDIRN